MKTGRGCDRQRLRKFAQRDANASFKELAQQEMQSIGDLDFAIRSIVSAVLVALLFSLATMMMQTTRERTAELAILKTLGFSDRKVLLQLVGEAVVACIAGAIMGLGLAMVALPYAAKFVPGLSMPMVVIEIGVVGAANSLYAIVDRRRRVAGLGIAWALGMGIVRSLLPVVKAAPAGDDGITGNLTGATSCSSSSAQSTCR